MDAQVGVTTKGKPMLQLEVKGGKPVWMPARRGDAAADPSAAPTPAIHENRAWLTAYCICTVPCKGTIWEQGM